MSTEHGNDLPLERAVRKGMQGLGPPRRGGPLQVAFTDLPSVGFVRQSQLIPTIVPFSAATLWRRVKSGEFPSPVKLSERVTAWRVEDVRAWIVDRAPLSS